MGSAPTWLSLIGPRRAGKTQLLEPLAAALGRPAFDLDREVERRDGRSIPAIFAAEGEPGFRAREARRLVELLAGPPGVLACGGGTPLDAASARLLSAAGAVVYLRVGIEEQHRRWRADPDRRTRPRLTGGEEESEIIALHRERDPYFSRLSDVVVDASGTPAAVLAACLRFAASWRGR